MQTLAIIFVTLSLAFFSSCNEVQGGKVERVASHDDHDEGHSDAQAIPPNCYPTAGAQTNGSMTHTLHDDHEEPTPTPTPNTSTQTTNTSVNTNTGAQIPNCLNQTGTQTSTETHHD